MTVRLLIAVLAATAALAACGGNRFERPGYAFGCPTGMEKKITDKKALIESKLEGSGQVSDIEVVDLRCSERNGLMRVEFDVKNESRNVRRFAYRFRWLDKEGMRAWDDEALKPVLVYGKTLHTISTVTPTPEVADFRLMLLDQNN
jgi:uncharacterized protein YcfL